MKGSDWLKIVIQLKSSNESILFQSREFFLKKWANPGLFLFLFLFFSRYNFNTNWKSIDGVLGIRTQGRRMVGADETTELWRPPK